MNKTGIIILAAGNSSRFGKPKQLLVYQGKTLVERIAGEALKAGLSPVILVTGAGSEAVSHLLADTAVEIIYNRQWQQGMASGIVSGLSKILLLNAKIQSVIIAVCDQPFVTASLFEQLMKTKDEKQKGIIGCAYADTIGTPVLFTKTYFKDLLQLQGDQGARKIVSAHGPDLAAILFEEGEMDIDSPEDYNRLLLRTQISAHGIH